MRAHRKEEIGRFGGRVVRAVILKGQKLVRGDVVRPELLDGMSPRQRGALEGAGYVEYFNAEVDLDGLERELGRLKPATVKGAKAKDPAPKVVRPKGSKRRA